MRPDYKIGLLVICFFAAVIPTGAGAALYALDDGDAEWVTGASSGTSTFAWGNNFNRMPGSEVITTISASFGHSTVGPNLDDSAITGSIWSDPNSDGNPDDAVQLASVSGIIDHFGENGFFNTYDISDTLVTPSFFVVFSFTIPNTTDPTTYFLAQYDENNGGPVGIAWNAVDVPFTEAGKFGSPDSTGGGFNYSGAFLIRAEGAASVPEPSTMLLLGSGLVGLVGYGRRRMKK